LFQAKSQTIATTTIQKANLCIQHAINALRGLGNNADADLVHELWRRCGRDDQTLSLFRQVYALS
jgi:hypothetical protein